MKTNKLIAAGALALSMAMTPVASLINAMPVMAETVSISGGTDNTQFANHEFKAYQIFSGTQGNNGVLGNVTWGNGVNPGGIVNAIQSVDNNSPLAGIKSMNDYDSADPASSAQVIVDFLSQPGNSADNSDAAKAFAKIVNSNLIENAGTEVTTSGVDLDAGYYLVKDVTELVEDANDVLGLSILQVTGKGDAITITPKNSKPTVDKWVKDEGDTNDDWGETADHDLNKQIDFKLNTNGLTKPGIENYDSYYLKFTDTLSEGLTFDSITSVKLGDKTLESGYRVTNPTAENGNVLIIEIDDLKALSAYSVVSDINVTVEYKAHLNEKAVLNTKSGQIENNNEVKLTYSNNPNGEGKGTSEPDKVYVASFKLTNIKKALSENGQALAGAGFELWKDNKVAVFKTETVNNHSLTVFQRWATAPITGTVNDEFTTVTSDADGDFSMYGLDAGTYTLKEVVTPAGYNTAGDTTVTINATHAEANDGANATVTLTGRTDTTTTVVNTQNGSLPETGGMGTTMIYGVGAVMVAGAAVFYVTNKRTRKD